MTAHATVPTSLDLSTSRQVPLARLTAVELRKMADTRAGLWLLVITAVVTVGVGVAFLVAAPAQERTFLSFIAITAAPQGFLLPVLGILLVTSEWSQRTALVTFTLTPHRGRVIAAKTLAALGLGLVAIAIAIAVAALAALAGGAADPWAGVSAASFGKFVLLQTATILQGLAFGLVFLNSAVAIVTFFIVPTVFSILTTLWSAVRDVQPWIDLGTAQTPLFMDGNLTGEQWAQLGTASLLWIVLPLVVGLARVLRSEVK